MGSMKSQALRKFYGRDLNVERQLTAGAKISCGLCFRAANRYGDFATLSVLSLQINGITQLPSQFHAFLVDARLPINLMLL